MSEVSKWSQDQSTQGHQTPFGHIWWRSWRYEAKSGIFWKSRFGALRQGGGVLTCSPNLWSRNPPPLKIEKIPPEISKKGTHRPENGELDNDRGLKMLIKPFHWGSRFSPGRCLALILEICVHKHKIFGHKFYKGKIIIFLKNLPFGPRISKISSRCLPGLNQYPQWIGFTSILSPQSLPNSPFSGLWVPFLEFREVFFSIFRIGF